MRSNGFACLVLLCGLAAACGDDDATPSSPCGRGELVEVGGARFCAFRESLVIEGGFTCPAALPYRIDLEGAAVCAEEPIDASDLPAEVCTRIERSCGGPADAMMPSDTSTRDAGPRDTGPALDASTDASPDASGDAGVGTYWTLQPATTDFFVAAERCTYIDGEKAIVRATIHWFSSCDEPGPVDVALDEPGHTVTLSASVWRQEGRTDCTPIGAAISRDVEVTGLTAGEWLVNGTVTLLVQGPPPPITCTAPGPIGAACLVDCDCLDGARCVPVRGDAVCVSECANTCTGSVVAPIADLACVGGAECVDDPNLGHTCAPRMLDACGASAPCPGGMACRSDGDFASYCEWSVMLGAAPRHTCVTDTECDAGLSCVEGTDGTRTCELRCTSERMPCPGPGAHACLAQAARPGSRWICDFLGE